MVDGLHEDKRHEPCGGVDEESVGVGGHVPLSRPEQSGGKGEREDREDEGLEVDHCQASLEGGRKVGKWKLPWVGERGGCLEAKGPKVGGVIERTKMGKVTFTVTMDEILYDVYTWVDGEN